MPDDPNALPQPASETAVGARRKPMRETNLIGPDSPAVDAFNNGAPRPEPHGPSEADPFAVRGS